MESINEPDKRSKNEQNQNDKSSSSLPAQEELDLTRLWKILWRNKVILAVCTLAPTLIAALVGLSLWPGYYESDVVFITSISQLQLGDSRIASVFLNSRPFKIALIKKHNLLPRLYPEQWDPAKNDWKDSQDKPTPEKSIEIGLFDRRYSVNLLQRDPLTWSVTYKDSEAKFAAQVLQGVVEELRRYMIGTPSLLNANRECESLEKRIRQYEANILSVEKAMEKEYNLTLLRQHEVGQETLLELKKAYEYALARKGRIETSAKKIIIISPPNVPTRKEYPGRTPFIVGVFVLSFFVTGTALLVKESRRERRKR